MKHILTLLFTLLLSSFAFSGEIPGNKKIPGPVTITGTTSEINSTTGQDLYLNKTTTGQKTIIPGNYSGIVNTGMGSAEAFILENTGTCTGTTDIKFAPPLIFKGHGWTGSADQTYEFAWNLYPNTNGVPSLALQYRAGGTGAYSNVFSIQSDANVSSIKRYMGSVGETITTVDSISCSSLSTVSTDQYSPTLRFIGAGWKTAATAASQQMSCGFLVAPEQGTTNPIGVFKWCYGTNTATPVEANELLRLEWGDRLGVTLNAKTIAGYVFDYSKAETVKPKIYTQATEPNIANDSTAYWKDSDDSKYYMILDVGGTQKKVEMT